MDSEEGPGIIIVGVCASGKSSLVRRLRSLGYDARQCAQEHSHVPTMWQRLSQPDILICLDAGAETINRRHDRADWNEKLVDEQRRRLAHARQAADLFLVTDDLSEEEVLEKVVAFLRGSGH